MDWIVFENTMLSAQMEDDEDSDKTTEEKKQAKDEWEAFVKNHIAMMKEQAKISASDSTVYVFDNNRAVAERMDGGKWQDEFCIYALDSMQVTIYSIKGGKPAKRIITPESTSLNWTNVRDSLVIDSSDTKDILGFHCVKYYLYHSHQLQFGDKKIEEHFELYVTDAIKFPFFIMNHEITNPVFTGCVLEIKRIEPEYRPFQSTKRATSFNRQIDATKFVLPEKFRE